MFLLRLATYLFLAWPVMSWSSTYYRIEQHHNQLMFKVDLPANHEIDYLQTQAAHYGINNQVEQVKCDGQRLVFAANSWQVPANCQRLTWQVNLIQHAVPVAKQQSFRISPTSWLFSSVSSLARLQHEASPAVLMYSQPPARAMIKIPLPAPVEPPLFILQPAKLVAQIQQAGISLRYYIDNLAAKNALPSINLHLAGVKYFSKILPNQRQLTFNVAFIGIAKKYLTLSGAAGANLLLVNYAKANPNALTSIMPLFIALHEGFHQISSHYPQHPAWLGESLANYYALKALINIKAPHAAILRDKFIVAVTAKQAGLLTVEKAVESGNRQAYGLFYTKGTAFWWYIDNLLKVRCESLDNYVLKIMQAPSGTDFDKYLPQLLHLAPLQWQFIEQKFLL